MNARDIGIFVAFASDTDQCELAVTVPRGTTIGAAIDSSAILHRFPEIDLGINRVGIFGRLAALDTVVEAGDRVEIYRPLKIDPKEIRRRRVARKSG